MTESLTLRGRQGPGGRITLYPATRAKETGGAVMRVKAVTQAAVDERKIREICKERGVPLGVGDSREALIRTQYTTAPAERAPAGMLAKLQRTVHG